MNHREKGFILITVLVFLCVITLIIANNFHNAAMQLKISHHQLKKLTNQKDD